jgi:hypothetical protein
MNNFRSITKVPLLLAVVLSPLVSGADLSTYRGFQFGMTLNAAVKHSGMDLSEVTTIHQRPARIQELTWKPGRFAGADRDTDPVQQVLLSFYDGQLSRMVVDYDGDRTSGLTPEDMLEAISARYGAASRPIAETLLPSASLREGVKVVARWEDADYSLDLVQSPYGSKFGLIAVSKRLDGLAQAAIATGTQLDEREAPQRQRAEELSAQSMLNKARLANKPHFRP